jgi:hypothetical protein
MIGLRDPAFVAALTPTGGLAPVAGMVLWLKAHSLALADNDPVATWPDASAHGNDATQASSGLRPLLKTGILNGRAVVRFDGVDDYLNLVDLSGLTAASAIVVVNSTTDGGVSGSGLWNITAATANQAYPYAAKIYETFGRTSRKDAITTPSVQAWRIYSITAAAGAWEAFLDGVSLVSDAGSFGIGSSSFIGATGIFGAPTYYFPGDIAELLIYPTALSAPDRETVEAYLAAEYAL